MSGPPPPTVTYLDNAATSWPKPPQVAEAMTAFLADVGANPGRSGHHRSVEAARIVYRAREALAELFGAPDPLRIAFCANGTEALNLALRGLVRPGQQVVTTGMEHNSVMRPLRALEREGVIVTVAPCSPLGVLDLAALERSIRPEATMVVATHASNVTGAITPVAELAALCRERGLLLLVDGAQSAGALPFSLRELGVDLFAFTGHKALLGPMGTGGLVVGDRVEVSRFEPLVRGGTGSRSELQEQPEFLPDKLESGTLNVVGLVGLTAGVEWVLKRGVEAIRAREAQLTERLLRGLREIPEVTVYGELDARSRTGTVSLTINGADSGEVGRRLDDEFGVAARVGLHCSPLAHETLGTSPHGTVRLSLGAFTTEGEIAHALRAVRALARASDDGEVVGGR